MSVYIFRTLRKIKTRQFCRYINGDVYISNQPELLSMNATMVEIINYSQKFDNAVGIKWENYEVVDLEITIKKDIEEIKNEHKEATK